MAYEGINWHCNTLVYATQLSDPDRSKCAQVSALTLLAANLSQHYGPNGTVTLPSGDVLTLLGIGLHAAKIVRTSQWNNAVLKFLSETYLKRWHTDVQYSGLQGEDLGVIPCILQDDSEREMVRVAFVPSNQ